MRCLALAQAWQDSGGRANFVMADSTSAIEQRLNKEGVNVFRIAPETAGTLQDAELTADRARKDNATWVVIDGYHFGEEYQQAISGAGFKLLLLDDNGCAGHYSADFVLNQNVHAHEAMYANRTSSTKLLLGLQYVLLRREFAGWRQWQRQIPALGRKLLVSMGGSDPENFTQRAVEALSQLRINDLEAIIVLGGGNPHVNSVEQELKSHSGRIRIRRDVTNMAELLAWADVGLVSAGTVSWEVCAMGLPSVLVPIAENQKRSAELLDRLGATYTLPADCEISHLAYTVRELLSSPELRKRLSQKARSLVHFDGAQRVIRATFLS
jgi:UDP-2,4-diacetamido-2,4,6-trideoxy-beta-L-altropyranose hydrolase